MKTSGDSWARQLLHRGIRFERRGDVYAALESYREAIGQVPVGTDLHQELTQILAALQSRIAQPGSRGPHYDGGVGGDPEAEEAEVRRNLDLARTSFKRGDWKSATQALEFVVRYRPFFVEEKRAAWQFLEEVRMRASAPAARSGGGGGGVLMKVLIGLGILGLVLGAGFIGMKLAGGGRGGSGGGTGGGGGELPAVQVNLPKELHQGSQMLLETLHFGGQSSGWTLEWEDGGGGGTIIRTGDKTYWRPPAQAQPGQTYTIRVRARDAQGRVTAPSEHAITIIPPG